MKNVIVEKEGEVTIVRINRPEKRNAVDRETANELVEAFKEFEKDENQKVAILTGNGGNFCAGADLKTFNNRLEAEGDGPMGPSRMVLKKPVIAVHSPHYFGLL